LVDELKPKNYKDEERKLFVDSSKRNLNAVLLHNGNTYASVPIAQATKFRDLRKFADSFGKNKLLGTSMENLW
jgi:hypothetical protein